MSLIQIIKDLEAELGINDQEVKKDEGIKDRRNKSRRSGRR